MVFVLIPTRNLGWETVFLDRKNYFRTENLFLSAFSFKYTGFSLVSRLEVAIFTNLDEKSLFSSVFVVFLLFHFYNSFSKNFEF
jgi:hypothetical protein